MPLYNLAPKNNIDTSILATQDTLADDDQFIFSDTSTTAPKARVTAWSNLLAKILAYVQPALVNSGTLFVTGMAIQYEGSTAPSGWLLQDSRTIGSSTSGATSRASADTFPLYELLWNSHSNSVLPIQDSTGASTIRGANAAADFGAQKRLPLPDYRGRVAVGRDDMGGTAANRITVGATGITGTALGSAGGSQEVTLTLDQIPAHTHSVDVPVILAGAVSAGSGVDAVDGTDPTATTSEGSGFPHLNVQPSIITNFIVKL